NEIGSFQASWDYVEIGDFNPHVRAMAGLQPHSEIIPVVRANGITSVVTSLGTGIVQGMASVIQLTGDTPERMEIAGRAALVVALPVEHARRRGSALEEEHWAGHWHGATLPPLAAETGDLEANKGTLKGERMEKLIALLERARLYAKRPTTNDRPTA